MNMNDVTVGRRIDNPYTPSNLEELLSLSKYADSGFVLITAAIAAEVLEKANPNNRPISKANVQKLIEAIKENKWHQGLTKLVFSKSDRLMDGQHRLTAIVQTDSSLVFDVTFNMSEDAFGYLDTNKKRSASDTLAVYGCKNVATLSSIARKVNHYMKAKGMMWNINTPCNNELAKEIVFAEAKMQSVAAMMDAKKDFLLYGNKSDLGTCYTLFSRIDNTKADEFMQILISNGSEYNGKDYKDLFGSLRKELTRNRNTAHKIHAGKKIDAHESESRTYWYMFDAWNAFRAEENREIAKKVSRTSFVMIEAHK